MNERSFYVINGITFYRLIAAPVLLFLVLNHQLDAFKWMLVVSFITDAADGFLARRFRVISAFGSRLDSIADDLTIGVAIIGMMVFKPEIITREIALVVFLLVLFIIQTVLAFLRYHKISSFHTYSAKVAAVVQAAFLILLFFLPEPIYPLFYLTVILTAIDLVEEIILVLILSRWQVNVKGLYWVLKRRHSGQL